MLLDHFYSVKEQKNVCTLIPAYSSMQRKYSRRTLEACMRVLSSHIFFGVAEPAYTFWCSVCICGLNQPGGNTDSRRKAMCSE